MAKNREPEKTVHSESESGEEEEDDAATSEETGESDSEPEQTQVATKPSSSILATTKKVQPVSSSKPQQQQASSSTEEEEESGSESDTDSDGPNQNIRPIASKPMGGSQKSNAGAKDTRSKPSASEPATPVKSTAAKRLPEEKGTEAKDAKKSKKNPEPENSEKKTTEDSKKNLFQRLWSEDDEIVLLKGMIDYVTKKKSDPMSDLNAFHDFIKKNLHVEVTRTQLQDKIRRLKKKYENNKSKEKDGKARTFTNQHEQKAYELSIKVWGTENGKENVAEKVVGSPKANGSVARKTPIKANGSVARKTPIKKASVMDNEESKDVKSTEMVNAAPLPTKGVISNCARVEETILSAGANIFEGGKGIEGEEEWNRLGRQEMEIYLQHLEVRSAQTKLVIDALRSRGQ